jgi:hypothetical protein
VRALEISWALAGAEPFFRADSLRAEIAPPQLIAGDIIVRHLTLYTPTLRLARAPGDSVWNIERGIASLSSPRPTPPTTGPQRTIAIEDATIEHGSVTIVPPSGESILIRELAARIPSIAISAPRQTSPSVAIASLHATLELPSKEFRTGIALSSGEFRFPSGNLDFSVARVQVDSSVFTAARGTYHFGARGLGLDATLQGERVMLADLRALIPRAPQEGTARFHLRIATDRTGRSTLEVTDLAIDAEGSHIHGAVTFAFGGAAGPGLVAVDLTLDPLTIALVEGFTGPLPYAGEITGRIRGPPGRVTFDLAARLTAPGVAEPFTAGLVGEAAFSGVGFQLSTLDIDLRRVPLIAFRPFIPGLSAEGVVSGHLFMEGMPGKGPTRLDLRLEIATGVIRVAGVIDLSQALPTYDLTGDLLTVRLQDLVEVNLPPALLSAHFTLVGQGIRPATAAARLNLRGEFTGWQTGPADSVIIQAALDRGTLALDTADLQLGPLEIDLAGRWRFEPPAGGEIRYRLAATSLAPFEPYLAGVRSAGVSAGSLQASGTLSGPLASPHIQGTLSAIRLAYDGWRADTLAATYDLVLRRPLREVIIQAEARSLETPLGTFSNATVDLHLAAPLVALDIRAVGAEGHGPLVVVADGRIEPDGRLDINLRRLRFELAGKEWALAYPARIEWGMGWEFDIEGFLLRETEGPGLVAIDGHYPPTETGELEVRISDLPVADLLATAGYGPLLMGSLSLDLRLRGPPAAARAGGTFRLVNGSYRGQAIALVEGTILAEDGRLDAQAVAQLDSAGAVQINASLPLVLDLTGAPDISIPRSEPMRVALVADSLALRLLTMTIPEVRRVEGALSAKIDISGTPAHPVLAGSASLQGGALTIVPLDQRYDSISGELTLADGQVIVEGLRAHSGGWATVQGVVDLTEPTNPGLELTALFNGFRAMGAGDREAAAVDGELQLTGTLQEPVIAGAVTIDNGNVALPSFRSTSSVAAVDLVGPGPEGQGEEVTPGPSLFDRLKLQDVLLTVGENLWVVTDQFRAQVAGALTLHKVEDGLEISGALEGDRGVFTLQVGPLVRRFTLVHTSVRFFGTPELNPALDVTASRLIPGASGQMTEILLHLTGTLNQPHVAVTTGTGAEVPESELLSFLLFGRPGFATQGQSPLGGPILEEAVFGIGSLAELASIGLEEALISDLGLPLDYFLIQPTQGAFGGLGAPTIVLGQEIAPNLYFTVNTGFGGLFGPTPSGATAWAATLQWRISPQWTLELSLEPVNPARFFRGIGTALPIVGFERQAIVELRRQWTY